MNANSKPKLRAVAPKAAEPSKPKVLIFGKPGVGKTWASLDFPGCYYIDSEGGANLKHYTDKLAASGGMYLGPKEGANDFDVVLEQIQALATEKHEFKTLVLDSVSHLFNTEVASEQDTLAKAGTKDEYGASRKPAVSKMRRAVNWLDRLDMNVIMIAHQKDEYTMVGGKREPTGVTFDCWDKLEYILHLALNITKEGPSRYAKVRKSRLEEFQDGARIPWSYDEFANRYGRDIIEGAVRVIEIATPEQVAELTDLIGRVRLPEDWLDKCLKRAKADTSAELEASQIAAMIQSLKEKLVA